MQGIRCGLLLPMFRGLCVSLLVTAVSYAKTAETIAVSFGTRTRVGPKNHVLGGALIPPPKEWGGVIYRAIFRPIVKNGEYLV